MYHVPLGLLTNRCLEKLGDDNPDTITGKGLMEEVIAEALIAGLIVCVDCDLN